MTYLDTSALVKRFLFEPGSARVRGLTESSRDIAIATVGYAEIYAALNRKRRDGDLSRAEYNQAAERFEMHWRSYFRVPLHDDILDLARALTERHPLRGFDAIHLASALSLRQALDEEIAFAAADHRLLQAAASEGLQPLDVDAAAGT
jgi:predicted nucleic acid-binding protein